MTIARQYLKIETKKNLIIYSVNRLFRMSRVFKQLKELFEFNYTSTIYKNKAEIKVNISCRV